MLRRELAGRGPGGRARRTFMDGVKEDVEMVGVRERRGCRGEGEVEAGDWMRPPKRRREYSTSVGE